MKQILSNLEHILSRLERSPALDESLLADIAALKEEARRLSRSSGAVPVAGELTVLRWEGDRAYLSGWVDRHVGPEGGEEPRSSRADTAGDPRPSGSEEVAALRSENQSLKENMQELILRFQEGIAAFEVENGYVTPLYASDNVCEYFGFTREEWLPLMKRKTLIRDFVSRSGAAYEEFAGLLRSGEAEFSYYDFTMDRQRRIRAVCSPKDPAAAPRYVLLYNVDGGGPASAGGDDGRVSVSIRTFGYFDVFVGGKPIAFRSQKSKELFALLVDRRGGYVSSEEAISFLWEDEAVSSVTLARYRKVALRLKNILAEYGISDVVESVDGKRRIVPTKVRCDLYDYLSGREEHAQLFKGSYLSNYSWGETTLAELTGDMLHEGRDQYALLHPQGQLL